ITTSGALGILIPPSIVMVMYSVATNTSVGQLFMAGVVPGLTLATMLGLTTWYRARKNNYPRLPKASWGERFRTFRQSSWGWMLDKGLGQVAFLLFVNVLLLLAGNVMEPSSIVLIMAPIMFPVAMKLGIDPVHFGIVMTVNMEIGMCHPPVGLNLYVASGIAKMGITELTVAVWPWLLTMLVFLVIVTYLPALSIWLPQTLGMMR